MDFLNETSHGANAATLISKMRVTDYTPLGLTTPCWQWLGAHDARGHARMKVGGRCVYVRREMLKCAGVTLDTDAQVISLCRDKGCVNPDHHLAGNEDEARVFSRWGRTGVGDLLWAKELVESGQATAKFIAYAWKVSERLIANGTARVRWVELQSGGQN